MSILVASHVGYDIPRFLGYKERAERGITIEDEEFRQRVGSLLDKGCLKLGVRDGYVEIEDDVKLVLDWVKDKELSYDALAAIFDELRSRVTSPPPPQKEDAFVKQQVKQAFERNPTSWLSSQETAELMMQNPRMKVAFEERFGADLQTKFDRLIPMMIGAVRKEGSLIYDGSSRKDRWRGFMLPGDLVDYVQHKDELELLEGVRLDFASSRFNSVADGCRDCIFRSLRRLSELLKREFKETRMEESFALMKRLGIDSQKPVSLKSLLRATTKDSDSAKLMIDTTEMYMKRLHEVINKIQEDPGTYMQNAADPSYYTTLAELEKSLRICIITELSRLSENWWKERIPSNIRENCEQRKKEGDLPYPWSPQADQDRIFYADFADYRTIIKKRDNWEQAFRKIFKDKEMIASKLTELEPIRRAIAHSRDLQAGDIDTLDLYSQHIMSAIARVRTSAAD